MKSHVKAMDKERAINAEYIQYIVTGFYQLHFKKTLWDLIVFEDFFTESMIPKSMSNFKVIG